MMFQKGLSLAVAGALLGLAAGTAQSAPKLTSLTVFGDSLVDAGNIATATGGAIPNSAQGYYDGRFTNGYDFTDRLSETLFGAPTTAYLEGGSNFAFGDARIVANSDAVPDLAAQLSMLATSGQKIDPTGLYELTFGANDVFAASSGYTDNYGSTDAYLKAAADQYASAIQTLSDEGARNILVTDFPAVTTAGNERANIYFKDALAGLDLGATTLYTYDLASLYDSVAINPAEFGLPTLNTTSSCIAANAQSSGCAGYFSFDGTHPTAEVENAAFEDMDAKFGLSGSPAAVPESATWLMLILGFSAIGGVMRRAYRQSEEKFTQHVRSLATT